MPYIVAIKVNLGPYLKYVEPPLEPEPVEKHHVTILYIGDRKLSSEVLRELSEKIGTVPPFRIVFRGSRLYPSPAKPRALAAPVVEGIEKLSRIRTIAIEVLRRYGIQPEDRYLGEFSPHSTYARIRAKPTVELVKLLEKIVKQTSRIEVEQVVKHVHIADTAMGRYVVVHSIALKTQ
ncbi:MAG: hypothetical protein DRJ40_01980 [Thermoprotei archaeon]|nr:MAG: hypothetical protein DRJ40_01980 [Thermoprotei archaeon]